MNEVKMENNLEITLRVLLVDREHSLKIYHGRTSEQKEVYMVACKYEPINVPSTKYIKTKKTYDKLKNMWQLLFILDSTYEKHEINFAKVFDDIIMESKKESVEGKSLTVFCEKYLDWQKLLSKIPKTLTNQVQQGLVGELYFLENFLIPKFGEKVAIEMWMGPLYAVHDFTGENIWYEVKTVLQGKDTVSISSLDQLDTTNSEGELIVIILEETNAINTEAKSIVRLVESIEESLDSACLYSFREKLLNVGYNSEAIAEDFEEKFFRVLNCDTYLVNDKFPKITRIQIDSAVISARYELNLPSLEMFKIK